jgi:pimeloyl-ACP methyl ester carboxylesterase
VTPGIRAILDRSAALAVIEGAGHALLHERPELIAPLLGDWLDRAVQPDAGAGLGCGV